MLDAETKRRIDNARDILVGKVPDPKTQVEQITFAMIYKFMDDMDQQSVGIGGEPSFFTNGYEQYAWSKLMDKRLGGEARLDLYVRALDQMSQNPHIPQLFRDIFKGAFLPYRDSETLNLFLKEMQGFTYEHSEDLGDAYEYLLSIFASQGKAGQFRTPRHIIDFIVDCVNPTKDDTMLDPACGTAGFLISAYKHILEAHAQNPLSPDEKQRLTENFVGYDISPDMVRLSRVNMYLHQFPNPTIHEYDTLTTEDRWDENYDVVLANPPFMTPKGGIRPHNRFAVRANRSEVLFVDYIAEHLNPGGRAGVVVPEGIIFQSGNAYKALRRMLVEEGYLYGVVSLPAGVFNPYSGVKTSILLLDKTLARRSDSVLFVKIGADGFDLGAQRREIERNDVPTALSLVKAFQANPTAVSQGSNLALVVKKDRLAEDANYNLSMERYRLIEPVNNKWPMVRLSEICEFQNGLWKANSDQTKIVKIIRNTNFGKNCELNLSDVAEHPVDIKQLESRQLFYGDLLLENSGGGPTQPVGRVVFFDVRDGETYSFSNFTSRMRVFVKNVDSKFLFFMLRRFYMNGGTKDLQNQTSGIRNLNKKAYQEICVPIPPIDVQCEIVEEIEGYQKVIDGARQVVQNYKPTFTIDPSWEMVKVGDVFETTSGGTPLRSIPEFFESGTIPWLRSGEVKQGYILKSEKFITEAGLKNSSAKVLPIDSVLVAMYGATAGQVGILKFIATTNQAICAILPNDLFVPEFIYLYLLSKTDELIRLSSGGAQPNISQKIIKDVNIPLVDINIQQEIVNNIQNEQYLVDANKQLIDLMEQKIQDRVQRVWSAN